MRRLPLFAALLAALAVLALPAHAAAAVTPPITEGAQVVATSDSIAQPHVAVVWDAGDDGVEVTVDGDDSTNTWTILLSNPLPGAGQFTDAFPSDGIELPCEVSDAVLTCTVDEAEFDAGLELWMGDGDDVVRLSDSDDVVVRTYLRGGTTAQVWSGQEFHGGPADDYVNTSDGATGSTTNHLYGGAGTDEFVGSTAPGTTDIVSYTDGRGDASPVTVTVGDGAGDGNVAYDGAESIGAGIDAVAGSPGDDVLTGSSGPDWLVGGAGDDDIDGGAGADYLYGGDGADEIDGGTGTDFVLGDTDTISTGSDNGATGDGNDTIDVAHGDGEDDEVHCNGGTADVVTSDAGDTVHSDCETGAPQTDSEGLVSVFTFGTLPERVIFDTGPTSAAIDVKVSSPSLDTWAIDYTTGAPVTPKGPECTPATSPYPGHARAECSVSTAQFNAGMELWLGNGDSTLVVDPNVTRPFLVHPEAGNNYVRTAAGSDTIDGATFATTSTYNEMEGGLLGDTFIGGAGQDIVSYRNHPDSNYAGFPSNQEFRLSLDGVANDGYLGDSDRHDDIGGPAQSIEGVIGSNKRDVITGSDGADRIFGGNGNDLIDGRGGDDHLYGQGDHDHVTGGTGSDTVFGDYGGTTNPVSATPDGSDTLVVNDGAADAVVDCGGAEDAATYDAGLDSPLRCENLTPPPANPNPPTDPNPTTPNPPASDPGVPAGWTRTDLVVPPTARDFVLPVAAWTKEGVTPLVIGFAIPTYKDIPSIDWVFTPMAFSKLPDRYQDDDVEPGQVVSVNILRGATPGVKTAVRYGIGLPQPRVELRYYDPDKGAPQNTGCPANGMVKGQGGSTFDLFEYVQTLPMDDALRELNQRRCRLDGAPATQRPRSTRRNPIPYAKIAGVRSVKVGKQRIVRFTRVVPRDEELRIIVSPDYLAQNSYLTLGFDDAGTAAASLSQRQRPGFHFTSENQAVNVTVFEAATGRLVPNAIVDVLNDDGKVISLANGKPVGYADKHVRTNANGLARVTFRYDRYVAPNAVGRIQFHAYLEDRATDVPLVERTVDYEVFNRGATLRSLAGVRYERTGSGALLYDAFGNALKDSRGAAIVNPGYRIASKQNATGKSGVARSGTPAAVGAQTTGIGVIDAIASVFEGLARLVSGSPGAQGVPGAVRLAQDAERSLGQQRSAELRLVDAAVQKAGQPGLWDGGGTAPIRVTGKLIGNDGSTLVAAGGGNLIGLDGGTLVAAGGGNLIGLDGGTLVAAGGGNLVAAGGGNLVAAGGGNLVAAGGGNLVAAGGGNIIMASGSLVAAGGGNAVGRARRGGRLVGLDWLARLRLGRTATDGKGTIVPSAVGITWVGDTPVLVGADNRIPEGTIIHTGGRGVPVNYPAAR